MRDIVPVPASRIPLHPYPAGWYAVAASRELRPGDVRVVSFAGREFVLYRTAAGVPALVEPHCPHLGAHFGYGGDVVGEHLRCPMHHFRFDLGGRCVATGPGYGPKPPPAARVRGVPLHEAAGLILAWNGAGEPTWAVPELADPAWGEPRTATIEIATHVQEIAENLFDIGHLTAVHHYGDAQMVEPPVFDGPTLRAHNRMTRSASMFGRFEQRIAIDLIIRLHGLGLYVIDVTTEPGGLETRVVFATTPVGPERLTFRASVWVTDVAHMAAVNPVFRWLPPSVARAAVARLTLAGLMHDVRQDVAVFDHKRHLVRPVLAQGDGPLPAFRRWASQFHTAEVGVAAS